MRRGPISSAATRSATVAPSGSARGSSFTVTCTLRRTISSGAGGDNRVARVAADAYTRPGVKTQPFASPPEDREMEGYEQDFYAWTQRTAELLRAGRFEEADIEHVAEEIEDMGRRDVRELNSR